MRLARIRTEAGPRVAVVDGDALRVLRTGDPSPLLADPAALDVAGAVLRPLAGAELLAPVAPRGIFGVGRNYGPAAPGRPPASFLRPLSCLAPPIGVLRGCPEFSDTLDYEGELGIVVGRAGRGMSPDEAARAIAGYVVVNDFTLRGWAAPETLPIAKGLDHSLPCGPWIVTGDEIADPHALRIRTRVNGEIRQDAGTDGMAMRCAEIVAMFSRVTTLAPGDLICTGSPPGSGHGMAPPRYLRLGDVVQVEIERIGMIETRIL